MLDFLTLQPDIFGLDISDASLRVVKLKKKHKGLAVSYIDGMEIKQGLITEGVIQDSKAVSEAIIALCGYKGKKLGTKYAVISLPEKKSFFQVIQMPAMTKEELVTAVPLEAENYIPLPIEKVYVDFQPIHVQKADSSQMDIMINGMPKPIIDSYVSCLKLAGLAPVVLEIESQAIVRALMSPLESSPPVICLDIGRDNTIFTIFSGNSIRFTTSIPVSSRKLTQAIESKLGISFEKAEKLKVKYGLDQKGDAKHHLGLALKPVISEMVMQIQKYIAFYQGHLSHQDSGHIHKVILCGGGASLKKLPEVLGKELHLPVEVGNPLLHVIQKKGRNVISPETALEFTTAIGLALRGAHETAN